MRCWVSGGVGSLVCGVRCLVISAGVSWLFWLF